jgi:hypothetical protein
MQPRKAYDEIYMVNAFSRYGYFWDQKTSSLLSKMRLKIYFLKKKSFFFVKLYR